MVALVLHEPGRLGSWFSLRPTPAPTSVVEALRRHRGDRRRRSYFRTASGVSG